MKNLLVLFVLMCLYGQTMYAQDTISRQLIPVAAFGRHMVIGLSVNSQNRVFVSFPNYDGDGNLALAEVRDGKISPYPSRDWNTKGPYASHFLRIQDLFVDANDMLWVLDSKPAPAGNIFRDGNGGDQGAFKLVKINTRTNNVEKTYFFDGLDKQHAALNDVRVDTKNGYAYLSDPGLAAIVVLDLKTGKTRTLLEKTRFTLADTDVVLTYGGKEMRNKAGKPFSSNVNGVALTHDSKYFYFKPINKRQLFRIATAYLRDGSLSEEEVESKVQPMGNVGVTHGLIAAKNGNIYLTSSESYSITYLSPDGRIHRLVHDPRLIWPDSMGIGSDGYLYVSCAQIQRQPSWNGGKDETDYPYRIYKVHL